MNRTDKIYVAGHLGLVGSALTKTLRAKGYDNIVGRSVDELDLRDPAAVRAFFDAERPDCVFLAAAKVGGIVANNTYRSEFIYDNLMIQNNVIDAAYRFGVSKLLFLGSTCIYPREAPQPMREDCLLTSPLEYTNEPYAIAKIAGIKLCESYNIQYGTNFIAVMPTNLYGPNDNFNLEKSHVMPALIRKIHLGKALEENDMEALKADFDRMPVEGVDGSDTARVIEKLAKYGVVRHANGVVSVEVWGTGAPMREFLWSEDMADACVFVMENVDWSDLCAEVGAGGNELRNCHLNIGTGREASIADLAAMIRRTVGFRGEIRFDASKPDGTMRKLTDPSRLHSLGWRHSVELEQGIGMLYGWYKNIE
ncbi:MAG: GDP-L-fucose synthase [Rikenellaceae bacterium]|jgi:GDP-L-fucose synthase|nr:GDP-L-fucose synthase [Rikenellaceae bacterium]